jgi:hypothetical protein
VRSCEFSWAWLADDQSEATSALAYIVSNLKNLHKRSLLSDRLPILEYLDLNKWAFTEGDWKED